MKPFEVSELHIKQVDAVQLVQLIKRLAIADLHTANLQTSAVHGTLQVNVSDGGEDVRVEWQGGPAFATREENDITIIHQPSG